MTNITSKQLDSDAFKSAEKQLGRTIARLKGQSSLDLLQGFLTESERIMLTKRFGAIFLLHHQYSPYRTASLLGLSEPTVHRIRENYIAGSYDSLLGSITKREESTFLNVLKDFALSRIDYRSRQRLMKRALR